MTVEDYLAFEKDAELRHEYLGGFLHLMAGGSGRHNRISLNIAATCLGLAPAACRVYREGMKLRADETTFYYPDVMVVCDKDTPDLFFESEPCILVEVLSSSTKTIDVREKLLQYKRLPSLQNYLIVDQESLLVRHLWRDDEGHWQQEDLSGSATISLPCLSGKISLQDIYRGIF
jgi:Uma2 family endonuclease